MNNSIFNPTHVQTIDDIRTLISGETFSYFCSNCGKFTLVKKFVKTRLDSYIVMKCLHCKMTNKLKFDESVEIDRSNLDLIYNLVNNQRIHYKCVSCGCIVHRTIDFRRLYSIKRLMCEKCIQCENHLNNPQWQQKSIESNRKNNNGFHYMQTDEGMRKHQECIRQNHSGLLYVQTEEFANSMRKKHKENPQWQQSSQESNRKNRNGVHYFQTEEAKNNLSKIAISNNYKISKIRYIFNGYSFDSFPEFAVYIYCIDFCIPIIRNNFIKFRFNDTVGKIHYTYPDFIICGTCVEIKGYHFYNENGTWKCPYTKKKVDGVWIPMTPEEKHVKDGYYESKHQCLLKNNVTILKTSHPWVQTCMSYVISKYGLIWVSQFYKHETDNLCNGFSPYNCDMNDEYQYFPHIGFTPFSNV